MTGDVVRRRGFLTLMAGAAAWPLTARAQRPAKIRRIGLLSASDAELRRVR